MSDLFRKCVEDLLEALTEFIDDIGENPDSYTVSSIERKLRHYEDVFSHVVYDLNSFYEAGYGYEHIRNALKGRN